MTPEERRHLLRRGLQFEALTIAWNVAEAAGAIIFGWLAGSVVLVAFGLDSVIEVISAGALFHRLRAELRGGEPEEAERRERRALRLVGWTFFALATYVLVESVVTLWTRRAPQKSFGGMVVAILALVVMPALGLAKLKTGRAIESKALIADAKETFSCAILSATVLLGLGLNAVAGWWWADPVAALAMVPFLIHEGREALEDDEGGEERSEEDGTSQPDCGDGRPVSASCTLGASMSHKITLFMWAYQDPFRIGLKVLAERTLEPFAPDLGPDVLLVGALAPGVDPDHPVCIEPEDEDWDVALFEGLEERIRALEGGHPNQNLIYGDEASNRELPGQIRSDAVRSAVLERVQSQDEARGRISFAGSAARVGKYDVVPVLLLDRGRFASYPALAKGKRGQFTVTRSLLEGTVGEILDEARRELQVPQPAKSLSEAFSANPEELVRKAGRSFMYAPHLAANPMPLGGLFDAMNVVASLRYEGAEGQGRVVIARPDHPALEKYVEFRTPVPLREPAWARKVVEMASEGVAVLCDASQMLGLGTVRPDYDPAGEDLFEVTFLGDQTWDLIHAGRTLMRTRYGLPGLPKPRLDQAAFDDTFSRLFAQVPRRDSQAVWDAVMTACGQKHGTMIVVAEDAAEEARRLERQGTPISPCRLSAEVIQRVTAIDGAVLLDPTCTCHAIGVILDGLATPEGTPARGARYNSALRYVATRRGVPTLAVIVSEDGYVTMRPTLRPRVNRSEVLAVLARVEQLVKQPNAKAIHKVRERLSAFRFYFDAAACAHINGAMVVFEKVYQAAGRIWIIDPPFEPDPRMNDSYWAPERER